MTAHSKRRRYCTCKWLLLKRWPGLLGGVKDPLRILGGVWNSALRSALAGCWYAYLSGICVNECDECACATPHTHAKSEMVMDTASLVTC